MAKTLLLADDSVTIQKVVGISFASEDVTLVTVDNGDDALAKARELRPDVILADVVMPGKNGYEVCEAVKADPNLNHVPVLLLTGTFEAFDEERAARAGAAGHIAKPFEAHALVARVQELLAQGPTRPAPAAAPMPAATAAEPAAGLRASAGGDEAFDFFDDDADFSEEEPILAAESAEPEESDLDGPDAAFAFGGGTTAADEIAFGEPASDEEPSAAERTVAILPDAGDAVPTGLDAVIGGDDLAAFGAPASDESGDTAPEPLAPLDVAVGSDDFDFDLDDAPGADEALLRVDSDDLAQATVLDPVGSDGYDVSSSDLGDPLAAEPDGEPPAALSFDDEPFDAAPEPVAELAPEPVREVAPEPARAPEPEPIPVAVSEPAPGPAAPAGVSLEEIEPRLREQLHDTLEKIAWESFNDVTEKIVRQALERVEKIAWEVIPQMAETLVREEIRRMKGEEPRD